MRAQSQSLNLPQSLSQQPALTSTSKPTTASTTTVAVSPHEQAVIGTASALGALGALVLVGLLYLIRRSRTKRLEQSGSELAPEVANSEETESTGHGVPAEMDFMWDWPSKGAHLGGPNELIGQDEKVKIAEMSG